MIPDCHTHLPDRKTSLLRVINGTSPGDWPEVAALADKHPGEVIPAFGLHPWFLQEAPSGWDQILESLLRSYPQALVGEIGLDKARHPRLPQNIQADAYLRQCRLARQYDRPVILHCVKAWGTVLSLLETYGLPDPGFLCHGFDAPPEILPSLIRRGAWFSLGPRQLSSRHADTLRAIPPDRLLLESDGSDADTFAGMVAAWADFFHRDSRELEQFIEFNTRCFLTQTRVPPEF